MRYREKRNPERIFEALTFDELIEHAKAIGAGVINGMPWSFEYAGCHVTHENDELFLIVTPRGMMRMNRGEFLLRDVDGNLSLYELRPFLRNHEAIE